MDHHGLLYMYEYMYEYMDVYIYIVDYHWINNY
jgi:hypothetical protein